jgi:hypothetical protein
MKEIGDIQVMMIMVGGTIRRLTLRLVAEFGIQPAGISTRQLSSSG